MAGRTTTFGHLISNIRSWQCAAAIEVHIQEQEQDFCEKHPTKFSAEAKLCGIVDMSEGRLI